MKLGIIGLGKMGSRIALKLVKEGHEIVVWNRSEEAIEDLKSQISHLRQGFGGQVNLKSKNLKSSESIKELVQQLEPPRVVWVMLPAGEATESVLNEIKKYVKRKDIVIDGGNSFYKDTERRYDEFKKMSIRFLGIGVSGGVIAAEKGYPLMAGGDKSAYEYIKPILESLSKPGGGYEYFGKGGAGHFVKMVHNGIEYGMMQSIGEGFGVLEKSSYNLDLLKVSRIYQRGTIISGFLMDRAKDALSKDSNLLKIKGYIEESGEAKWTVEKAREENVPIEIIEGSLEFRRKSQKDKKIQKSFAAKMVAALRHEFGGHKVREK